MLRLAVLLVACIALAAGCSGSPSGPDGDRTPKLSRTHFLAFGDSITAGEVTVPVGSGIITSAGVAGGSIFKQVLVPAAAYPTLLQAQLTARYATQSASITMTNAGKPGEGITEAFARFPQTIAANSHDVLLLMDGVNSLWIAGSDISTDLMQQMVHQANAQGTRVFVGSMLPSIAGRSHSQDPIELVGYNNKLRLMATLEGAVFVNLYDTLIADVATLIGVDGLHPTEAGYRRIADLFFEAIRANLEQR